MYKCIHGTVNKWFSHYILNESSFVNISSISIQSHPIYYVITWDLLSAFFLSIHILPIHDIT